MAVLGSCGYIRTERSGSPVLFHDSPGAAELHQIPPEEPHEDGSIREDVADVCRRGRRRL